MTETVVTTAEEELRGLIDWMGPHDPSMDFPTDDLSKFKLDVWREINRRLNRIEAGCDGWRSRCLMTEKKNERLIEELQAVRDELIALQNPVT